MKFCDEKIQKHLLSGGKIKRTLETYEVTIHVAETGYILDEDDDAYQFGESDLTATNWKIVEHEYDWDKIIKYKVLCVFSNNVDFKCFSISTLISVDKSDNITYYSNEGFLYSYCKPFNLADFHIAKNLKEYEK